MGRQRDMRASVVGRLCLLVGLLGGLGCGGEGTTLQQEVNGCSENLGSLSAQCPVGTAPMFSAEAEGQCQQDGEFLDLNGSPAGRCLQTGSCTLICQVVVDCACGAERITRDEVICAPCDGRDLGGAEPDAAREDANPDAARDLGAPDPPRDLGEEPPDMDGEPEDLSVEPDAAPEEDTGCTPVASCAAVGAECGLVDNGCGGTLDCRGCGGQDRCVANRCEPPGAPQLTECISTDDVPEGESSCAAQCQRRGMTCVNECEGDSGFQPGGTFPFILADWCEDPPQEPAPLSCGAAPFQEFAESVRCCCR